MLLRIPGVLSQDEVTRLRARIDPGRWVDGNATSGHQSAKAKYNLQLPEDSPAARECGESVLAALARNALFFSAVLPRQVYPPLFNRYGPGMTFGKHVDGAIRVHPPTSRRIRTDVSATLFLTSPDEYDGGELTIDDTYGAQAVKLPAGAAQPAVRHGHGAGASRARRARSPVAGGAHRVLSQPAAKVGRRVGSASG